MRRPAERIGPSLTRDRLRKPREFPMAIEKNLPENLLRTAHAAAKRESNANTAVWHITQAIALLESRPRQVAMEGAVTIALMQALYAAEHEAAQAKRLAESAARIADEAAGCPWEDDEERS